MSSLLRVSVAQLAIYWEDRIGNLRKIGKRLKRLSGTTDLVILPETFSTGFSMNVSNLAETMDGNTMSTLKKWANEFDFAIAGSFIAKEENRYYNRAFFITPEGDCQTFDKRHLFRMGGEQNFYAAGNSREIVRYRGWNIRLLVCYDLRFPIWSRNFDNAYDLLVYVANWPESRATVWNTLLPARALENLTFVCGVNRVGTDGNNLSYSGNSVIYSPRGKKLLYIPSHKEAVRTCTLNKEEANSLREKFPAWKDADKIHFIE